MHQYLNANAVSLSVLANTLTGGMYEMGSLRAGRRLGSWSGVWEEERVRGK
jgi:hypothetical protein